MIRRPPRSTLSSSSAASDVYKRQGVLNTRSKDFYDIYKLSKLRGIGIDYSLCKKALIATMERRESIDILSNSENILDFIGKDKFCLLYTSDAADEEDSVDLGGRRIIKKKKKK